ncbi:hypothetical protein [Actinokineospora sp. HUAS TT18]|uniref:hypothetical protein n=1 Tax=Actinokineospora sp. HUAS TT18 TaxID=3447451 RepID=UPI003F5278F5
MAEISSLRRLTEQLPTRIGNQNMRLENDDSSFQLPVAPSDAYVWPDVDVDGSIGEPKVIVITAPGAGGKSAAARAIAAECGAPLVDLAKLQVGSDSLVGLLTRVLGWDRAAEFVNRLRAGNSTLVLDSLDEAQLLAGRENFLAFLRNVASLVTNASRACRIILLGRRDAAGVASHFLKSDGVSVENWTIRPLYHTLGADLINLTLDRKKRADGSQYHVHRSHPIPFGKYRDQTFAEIAVALGVEKPNSPGEYWPMVQDFLGYPPVLMVLAEKLAVDNPEALHSGHEEIQAAGDRTAQGVLLRQVVEGILDRESAKVQAQLANALTLDEPGTKLLYLREEQSLRVLKEVSGVPIDLELPGILKPGDRGVYEKLIEPFVPDHPFVSAKTFSNVVFSDYIRAFIATSETVSICGYRREELLSLAPPVGPFFARFVYALTQDVTRQSPEGQIRGQVTESIVDALLKSHFAGGSDSANAVYNHSQGVEQPRLSLADVETAGQGYFVIEFDIEDPTGVLELSSPIANLALVTDHALVLNATHGEVEVGPNVLCLTKELEIDGSRFTANGGDDSSVLIVAHKTSHAADLRLSVYPTGCLKIHWPDAWHQWRECIFVPSSRAYVDPMDAYQILFWARRILTSFRGSMMGRPSIFGEQLERLVVGGNKHAVATLQGLLELGIVEKESSLYRLKLDVLRTFGVSWTDMTGSNFQEGLSSLQDALLRTESVLSLVSRPM